jgi:hypothetical protein
VSVHQIVDGCLGRDRHPMKGGWRHGDGAPRGRRATAGGPQQPAGRRSSRGLKELDLRADREVARRRLGGARGALAQATLVSARNRGGDRRAAKRARAPRVQAGPAPIAQPGLPANEGSSLSYDHLARSGERGVITPQPQQRPLSGIPETVVRDPRDFTQTQREGEHPRASDKRPTRPRVADHVPWPRRGDAGATAVNAHQRGSY